VGRGAKITKEFGSISAYVGHAAQSEPNAAAQQETVIQFMYPELPVSKRSWWLVVETEGGVDLCWIDPGLNVDLYVSTDLRTRISIWMGLTTVRKEGAKVILTGNREVAAKIQVWLGLSPFAIEPKRVAA